VHQCPLKRGDNVSTVDEEDSNNSSPQTDDEVRNPDGAPSQDYEPICVLNPSGEKPGIVSKVLSWIFNR
jgi:hypothetical protein